MTARTTVLLLALMALNIDGFQIGLVQKRAATALHGEGTGGWGIGGSRELIPEEFAKGDRRAFEGYNLQDRGEFMRQLNQDKEALKNDEMAELLGVAKIAGLNVKNPKDRLNKFDDELMDDDDDLDVST